MLGARSRRRRRSRSRRSRSRVFVYESPSRVQGPYEEEGCCNESRGTTAGRRNQKMVGPPLHPPILFHDGGRDQDEKKPTVSPARRVFSQFLIEMKRRRSVLSAFLST